MLSPSTRLVDLNLKRARYEAAGCDSYWVVDPTAPSIATWELRDGAYVEVASMTGGELFIAAHPFAVALAPRTSSTEQSSASPASTYVVEVETPTHHDP